MRTLLIFFFAACFQYSAVAQQNVEKEMELEKKMALEIDKLFEVRTSLLLQELSTREVDAKLASLGVKFPAKVKMANLGSRISIAFFLIEETQSKLMLEKIRRLKEETPGLEYVGLDESNYYCYATFKSNTPERRIESFLSEFLYEGFYVSKVASIKEVLLRD